MRPVKGLLDTTANFADVVNGLPTSGLNTKNRLDSGASAGDSAEQVSNSNSTPKPAPPNDRSSRSGSSGITLVDRSERFTRR